MSIEIQNRLQAYCIKSFPAKQNVKVSNLVDITSGWECELYSFDLEWGAAARRQRERLILRLYHGYGAPRKAAHEFNGMRKLKAVDYPVPRVMALECQSSLFGKPFVVMEKIEGQVMRSLLCGSSEAQQQKLTHLFCGLFVQLHTLDWRPFVDDVAGYEVPETYRFVDRWLSSTRKSLMRYPDSDFLPVVEWLQVRRDSLLCLQPAVVHWDYHPSNVLVRGDGSAAVIDWPGLHVTDSRFDLAWTLVLENSGFGVDWRNCILQEYERITGAPVTQMECFEVFACVRRLLDVTISLSEGPEKLGMRAEATTLMKKQMDSVRCAYRLLIERTGLKIKEVEKIIGLPSLGMRS